MFCVVIVGGGAAGIFAAIRCKETHPNARVLVLEKSAQLLVKVRLSGGGRCNVTHACFGPKTLTQNYPRGSKELLGPFHTFQPKETIAWFETRGVPLKIEADGRIFPTSDTSSTILDCLLHTAQTIGVEIALQQRLLSCTKQGERFRIQLPHAEILADKVVLATGSSPSGHDLARALGHTIVEPVPSLFTFNVPSSPLLDLAGISIPRVRLSLLGKRQEGPLLLTHWGFSGPAVLKLSAWAARELYACGYKTPLEIAWVDAPHQEALFQKLLTEKTVQPLLPHALWVRLLERMGVDPKLPRGKVSHDVLRRVASMLLADRYLLEGKTTYKQEFVTAGGVELKEVDFKRMESRLVPGLFFAGEILNIDGVTGGFNFQNAWTTAWIAGSSS